MKRHLNHPRTRLESILALKEVEQELDWPIMMMEKNGQTHCLLIHVAVVEVAAQRKAPTFRFLGLALQVALRCSE